MMETDGMSRAAAVEREIERISELCERIDSYFAECEGVLALDEETGLPMPAKGGGLIYERPPKSPTVTGLALALGFNSRTELLKSQKSGRQAMLLKRAISRVEENAERRLLESGVGGAKFFLAGNFEGWDKAPDEDSPEKPASFSEIPTDILKKYLEELKKE